MEMSSRCSAKGRAVLLFDKINYSANTASVASRQATARNITDSHNTLGIYYFIYFYMSNLRIYIMYPVDDN